MFTVKATYRGETRKFLFSADTFPSFEQLCNQLYRVFHISGEYHMYKLLFSPNATQGGRILIGREVSTAEGYNKSIEPYKDRLWPHGLLRFSVYDETPHKAPNPISQGPSTMVESNSWSSTLNASSLPLPHLQSSSRLHPPPIIPSTTPMSSPMEVDDRIQDNKRKILPACPCCPIGSAKQEIQKIITDFKGDLDRILETSFDRNPPMTSLSPRPGHPHPPSLRSKACPTGWELSPLCSICTQSKQSSWFTCRRCLVVVCSGCLSKNHPLCFGTMGPHQWDYTQMPALVPPWLMAQSSSHNAPSADVQSPSCTSSVIRSSHNEGSATPTVPFIPPQMISTTREELTNEHTSLVQPVIHKGVICDVCEDTIHGVRHKCLDCPDYDLCTRCVTSGGTERHNPAHQFLEIREAGRVIVHTVNGGAAGAQVSSATQEPAPEAVSHYATCDLCESRIQGDRYKCLECPDFDTCSSCFRITEIQHPRHGFARLRHQGDLIKRHHGPRAAHFATCNICRRHILGVRFRCMHPDCTDFDLCDVCEAHPIPLHPESHPLLKVKTPDTLVPPVLRGKSSASSNLRPPETEIHPTGVPDSQPEDDASLCSEASKNPFVWGYMQAPSVVEEFGPQPPSTETTLIPRLDEISPSIIRLTSWTKSQSDQEHFSSVVTDLQENDQVLKEHQPESTPDQDISASIYQGTDNASQVSLGRPTWPCSANELAHLMESSSHVPSATAQQEVFPLTEQDTQLTLPAEECVPSMQQKSSQPVTLTHRTLSMLLSGYQSPSSNAEMPSSIASLSLEESKLSSQLAEDETATGLKNLEDTASKRGDLNQFQGETAASVEKHEEEVGICQSAMFIEDVTVPDGQIFPPGAEFMKCWKMRNDSEYDWPETTELVYVAGERLGVKKDGAVHVGRVKAGAEVELWTGELKAPDVAGRYVSYWRLRDVQGKLFGGSIWIDIVVADALSDGSDKSIASSLVVMPQAVPERFELTVQGEYTSASTAVTLSIPPSSTDGAGSDIDSDVSLISLSTSDDDAVWEEVASSVGDRQSQATDYVLLYDDRSSEGE